MSSTSFPLKNRHRDFNIERFKTRLTAKCCVVFVAVTQTITRLVVLLNTHGLPADLKTLYIVSLVLLVLLALVVCFEYFLFKKVGPKVMHYSKIIDIILLIIFSSEWIINVLLNLLAINKSSPPIVSIPAIFGFIDFAWRTLFLLFLIQNWKFLIIPPTIASLLVISFCLHFSWTRNVYTVMLGFPQMFYTILMLYFLDKIKWKEVFTNTQQERWMQINQFVLNNIPENILILDFQGEVNFVSDYCRAFMQKVHLSQNPKDLFLKITDLYEQPKTEPSSPSNTSRQIERATTMHAILEPEIINSKRIDSLKDLIENFKTIRAHLQEREFLVYNGSLKVEDHHIKAIEIKISYIQQYDREYIILIIRDTTQRDLLVTLQDNNKYKDQLLASVSHELRTPLNGNINLVETALQDKSVPGDIKERLLTPALRSSQFLLHLINDILDMSQIKAKKMRLIFKFEKLSETLKDTLQLVELQAKKKGIGLEMNLHPNVNGYFCTDHVRLSQIILNLLNNAIKFTQKGSVVLSAITSEDDGPNCVRMSVKDSGIGMADENIKKLFSAYTHIEFEDRAAVNPTGIGLGLNIAYNLAKLLGPKNHQGITVESLPKMGSTFSFILENKKDQLDPQDFIIKKALSEGVPEELEVSEPSLASRLFRPSSVYLDQRALSYVSPRRPQACQCAEILIVDDNPFNTMAFEAVLGSLNLKCDSVFDGRAAIDKILERQRTFCGGSCKPFRVVFMDQEMPGLTGSETVREIKRLQVQGLIPPMKIIGCTAHGSSEEVEKFMESGIEMCIQKPVAASELQKILKR